MLHGHVPSIIAKLGLHPISRLDSTKHLHLAIGLPTRNQAMLNNLLNQIYNPASPNYHKYLTSKQSTENFGPTENDYQAVKDFATKNNLNVIGSHSSRMILDLNGTVADIEKAFKIKMQVYNHPTENRTFFAPDIEPSVNMGLPILDINGLSDYAKSRPNLHKSSSFTASGSEPTTNSYWGYNFRHAYLPNDTLSGYGQSVGLFEMDGYYPNDIQNYETNTGLPQTLIQKVLIDGLTGNPRDLVEK